MCHFIRGLQRLIFEGPQLDDGHTLADYNINDPQRQHVSIRQYTSAYVSIRQHMSAYVSIPVVGLGASAAPTRQHTSAYVSIRQHTSAYVSIRAVGLVASHRTWVFSQSKGNCMGDIRNS